MNSPASFQLTRSVRVSIWRVSHAKDWAMMAFVRGHLFTIIQTRCNNMSNEFS